MVELNKYW